MLDDEVSSSEMLQHQILTEDEEYVAGTFPDWQLIDEISIRLLEQGIGTFETLQRVLPSIVLANIERVIPSVTDGQTSPPSMNEDQKIRNCNAVRTLKLFRLAQMEINYLLSTQQEMVEKLTKLEHRAKQLKRENRLLREQFYQGPSSAGAGELVAEGAQWGRELFRCNECTKLFLHANFLAEHIQRKHNGQLETAARLSSVKRSSKAEKVLGLDELGSTAVKANQKEQPERTRAVIKRKGPPPRGQSHGSGTFRKRNDHFPSTTASNAALLPRHHSQTNKLQKKQQQQQQGSYPSSSIGEEIFRESQSEKNKNNKMMLSDDESTPQWS